MSDANKTKSQQAKSSKDSTTLSRAEAVDLAASLETLSKTSLEVNETFSEIGRRLITKYSELEAIEGAIKLKREEMKELHGADKILLTVSELESERSKIESENQQIRLDKLVERNREEDNFQYQLSQKRKNEEIERMEQVRLRDNDERDRREAFDKWVKTKTEVLTAQEKDYQNALEKAKTFDEEVRKASAAAEAILRNSLTRDFNHDKQLTKVQHEAQISALQKDVEHKTATITSKDTEILALRDQLAKAIQAQTDLASKTVEGANDKKSLADMQSIVTNVGSNGQRART